MSRPDESIEFLKDRGYCVLRLPRSDVRPLQTLLRAGKKDLVRLGELATIAKSATTALPKVSNDNAAPSGVSGKESSSTKIEVGVNILGNIIKALGGNTLGVTAAYNNAKTMTFKFDDVLEDHIEVDRLDQYLTSCTFDEAGATVIDSLEEDAVFVITSTLKTKKLTVNASGERGSKVGLEVPVISQIASGNLAVDATKATEGTVTYEGTTPVVFGFQAVQIFAEERGGRQVFTALTPLSPGAAAARGIGRPQTTKLELDQGAFFRLADAEPGASR